MITTSHESGNSRYRDKDRSPSRGTETRIAALAGDLQAHGYRGWLDIKLHKSCACHDNILRKELQLQKGDVERRRAAIYSSVSHSFESYAADIAYLCGMLRDYEEK